MGLLHRGAPGLGVSGSLVWRPLNFLFVALAMFLLHLMRLCSFLVWRITECGSAPGVLRWSQGSRGGCLASLVGTKPRGQAQGLTSRHRPLRFNVSLHLQVHVRSRHCPASVIWRDGDTGSLAGRRGLCSNEGSCSLGVAAWNGHGLQGEENRPRLVSRPSWQSSKEVGWFFSPKTWMGSHLF